MIINKTILLGFNRGMRPNSTQVCSIHYIVRYKVTKKLENTKDHIYPKILYFNKLVSFPIISAMDIPDLI